jgi:glycosyltransferase involved in cell wall biosynthesis
LRYPGQEIEVVVLDNCSTDNTQSLLAEIKDLRFSFFKNEENIGGTINPLKALSLASGKFAFLCLDKDYLNYQGLEDLFKSVKSDPGVIFGHCALNIKNQSQDVIYEKGYQSVKNMAYLSRHPTGFFFRTNEYINLALLQKIFVEKKPFPFYSDLINAEMAMKGKSKLINIPAFYTESKDEASKIPSFTYAPENVYFSPQNRLVEFDAYLESVQKLDLTGYELFKLTLKIYGQALMLSTFGYKNMMGDYDVCAHHRIELRKVGLSEIWKLSQNFSAHFLHKQTLVNKLQKLLIVLYGHAGFMAKSILTKW